MNLLDSAMLLILVACVAGLIGLAVNAVRAILS